jgi:hypothetical protein
MTISKSKTRKNIVMRIDLMEHGELCFILLREQHINNKHIMFECGGIKESARL